MSVRIRVCTTIDAPPATVWAAIEHIESHMEWMADAPLDHVPSAAPARRGHASSSA